MENINKFTAGEEVFAKENPNEVLVVRRYLQRIYYCTIKDRPDQPELVYFERELVGGKDFVQK